MQTNKNTPRRASAFVDFSALLTLIALIIEIIPRSTALTFAHPGADGGLVYSTEYYSYFSLMPFGYGNAGPLIAAILTCVSLLLIEVYFARRQTWLLGTELVVSGAGIVTSLLPLLLGFTGSYGVLSALITASLAGSFVLLISERKRRQRDAAYDAECHRGERLSLSVTVVVMLLFTLWLPLLLITLPVRVVSIVISLVTSPKRKRAYRASYYAKELGLPYRDGIEGDPGYTLYNEARSEGADIRMVVDPVHGIDRIFYEGEIYTFPDFDALAYNPKEKCWEIIAMKEKEIGYLTDDYDLLLSDLGGAAVPVNIMVLTEMILPEGDYSDPDAEVSENGERRLPLLPEYIKVGDTYLDALLGESEAEAEAREAAAKNAGAADAGAAETDDGTDAPATDHDTAKAADATDATPDENPTEEGK